jgi:hypothetical protein
LSTMNKEMLAKCQGHIVRLVPIARPLQGERELEIKDDDWRIGEIDAVGVKLHNQRATSQVLTLGLDQIHSYMSDPMSNVGDQKHGFLHLLVQVILTEHGPKIEPLPRGSAPTSPPKWTGLLASAAPGTDVHPAYAKILAEITPAEARLLDVLYRWETTSDDEGDRDLMKHARLSEKDLPVFGMNLGNRHGLIHGYHTSLWKPDLTKWNNIALTPLGRDFVRVCRGPSG